MEPIAVSAPQEGRSARRLASGLGDALSDWRLPKCLGVRSVHLPLPPVAARGYAVLTFERLGEGVLRAVAAAFGDGLEGGVGAAQESGRRGHPPPGEVGQGWLADDGAEAF